MFPSEISSIPTTLSFFSNRTCCALVNLPTYIQLQVLKAQSGLQQKKAPVLSSLLIWKGCRQPRRCWDHYMLGTIPVLSPPAGILETDLALQTSPPLPARNKSCGFRVGEWIHIQLGIYGDFMDPTNASLPPFSGNHTIPAVHSLRSIAFFQGSTSNCLFTDMGFCKE